MKVVVTAQINSHLTVVGQQVSLKKQGGLPHD